VAFERDVLPVLAAHCLTCHGGIRQRGGLDLRTPESVLTGGKSGTAIVAGSAEKSLLWKKIAADEMPKGDAKLSKADKEIFRTWIEKGAKTLGDIDGKQAPLAKKAIRPTSEVARAIDAAIDRHLEKASIPASGAADDAEFMRRLYLDLTGRIPTVDQAKAFLASQDPNRREKLINELLESPSYASHFGTGWHNLLVPLVDNKRVNDEPLLRWLTEGFGQNRPWNRTVSELLTASGNTETNPALGFLVTNKEPLVVATRTAKLFLGVRLECAECHNHPLSTWKQENFWGMAAFFQPVQIKKGKGPTKSFDVLEVKLPIKGDTGKGPAIKLPDTAGTRAGKIVRARFLDDTEPKLVEEGSYRPQLAGWVTGPGNLYFPKASVNRLWGHFFGRGLVHPVDDLEAGNQPVHPAILQSLAQEFVSCDYDFKHAIRCICMTKAYQRSSVILPGNQRDSKFLSRMPVRTLTAEMLHDSLALALDVQEISFGPPKKASPQKKTPPKSEAPKTARPGSSGKDRSIFVNLFNTQGEDGEATDFTHGIPQALRLLNGVPSNYVSESLKQYVLPRSSPEEIIDRIYLGTLSRYPTADERKLMMDHVGRQRSPETGYASVLWVVLNSSEFVVNH
jgi:hypothetical protein